VIHRDVKPENIMIERGSGRAIVTDFGIARVEFGPTLTQDALILGTASYMSPEQINGEALDGRSDLYALGVVGFLLLSGRLPFSAENVSGVLHSHVHRPAPTLASIAPRVPAPIAAVIDRCLAKDRTARFPTGESLADALEKALRISEPALTRTGEFDARTVSPREAALALERASALQRAAVQETTDRITGSNSVTVYTVRELEAEATAAGLPVRLVRRALAELKTPGSV
jgi:serine/threonine protein kinase